MRFKGFVISVAAAFVSFFCATLMVSAQTAYPEKPIRIIVPYAAGGATDIMSRRMGQRLSEILGQPVVVENRSGGNTVIGTVAVSKAPPDGYTLLFTTDTTFILNPIFYQKPAYDIKRDLTPVSPVAYTALLLAVRGDFPPNSMKEMVSYIKNHKGELAYGSVGAGSQPHIMGEAFTRTSGANLIHVPYKGSNPAINDLLGGQIIFAVPAIPTIQGHLNAGTLKVLGVSGTKRLAALPDVPTFVEAGFDDMNLGAWYGIFAPAGTPRNVVDKLNDAVKKVLVDRDFVENSLSPQGMTPMIASPKEMEALVQSETERMRLLIERVGVKVE